jgi:hypothetical protein
MGNLLKAKHHVYRSRCSPGKTVVFAATPYEGQTHFGGAHNPANPSGYSWEGTASVKGGYLGSGDYAGPRGDLKFLGFRGSGMGFTFTHEAKGRSANYSAFHGNRGIRTELFEFREKDDSTWQCHSGGHVASSIILPQGVSSRRGLNGEDVLTIQSATPDAFLGQLSLPPLPYILAKPANEERFAQYFLAVNGYLPYPAPAPSPLPTSETRKAGIQNALGYTLQGEGQGGIADGQYIDPFSGFANYRDNYTMKVGELMQPAPANDLHFFNQLSAMRVVVEILTNHALANGKALGQTFGMEILTNQDPEYNLLHFEVSGSINSIIQEAANQIVGRAWWDSRSNFHFISDYYSGYNAGTIALTLKDGPSLVGEIEVGQSETASSPVNSYRVRGQPFQSFGDAESDPLTTYYDMALGAKYPPGAVVGAGPGSDPTDDSYLGKNAAFQAKKLYYKSNAQTTFTWKNVPYPTLVMGLLNRLIKIDAKDPKGAWDFTGGKLFVVTDVEGSLQDAGSPNGGYWLCTVSGIEVNYG